MINKEKLSAEELLSNYNEAMDFIKSKFSGERQELLLELFSEDELGERSIYAPASGRPQYHCCFVGGYWVHIMNVCKASIGVKKLYETMANRKADFTDEEMFMSAFCHDLGKLGDKYGTYYEEQKDEWRKNKLDEHYTFNKKVNNFDVPERGLWTLQDKGIKLTQKEWLAIKLSDGMYHEPNQYYLKSYDVNKQLKTALPYIIHTADFISTHAERHEELLTSPEDNVKI